MFVAKLYHTGLLHLTKEPCGLLDVTHGDMLSFFFTNNEFTGFKASKNENLERGFTYRARMIESARSISLNPAFRQMGYEMLKYRYEFSYEIVKGEAKIVSVYKKRWVEYNKPSDEYEKIDIDNITNRMFWPPR